MNRKLFRINFRAKKTGGEGGQTSLVPKFLSAVKHALLKIAEVLDAVGFNTQLLGSSKYVLAKLQELEASELDLVREAFIRNRQPRFMKQFFSGLPYGRHKLFKEKIREANLKTLARLIKICGLLLQTKVYLFWKQHRAGDYGHKNCTEVSFTNLKTDA